MLGDAYRLRAERRWTSSTQGFDEEERRRHFDRIRDDCRHALEQYELVPSYPGVSRHIQELRQRLAEMEGAEQGPSPLHALENFFHSLGGSP